MGIYILKVSCVVVKGGANDVDKALADEYFLCKEEMGVWTLKYLTVKEGSHKNNVHLKQASPTETYAVKDNNKYMESVEKYKTLYNNKYKPDNAKLTMAMITTSWISFKCDLQMEEDEMIDEHIKEVHNVSGLNSMKPAQKIQVDAKWMLTMIIPVNGAS